MILQEACPFPLGFWPLHFEPCTNVIVGSWEPVCAALVIIHYCWSVGTQVLVQNWQHVSNWMTWVLTMCVELCIRHYQKFPLLQKSLLICISGTLSQDLLEVLVSVVDIWKKTSLDNLSWEVELWTSVTEGMGLIEASSCSCSFTYPCLCALHFFWDMLEESDGGQCQ